MGNAIPFPLNPINNQLGFILGFSIITMCVYTSVVDKSRLPLMASTKGAIVIPQNLLILDPYFTTVFTARLQVNNGRPLDGKSSCVHSFKKYDFPKAALGTSSKAS